MSKKLAAGADAIVLDVKTGSGAFMKKEEDAFALAKEMVRIGNGAGRKTIGVISDMDQPLGNAVGNILEVKEAVETLKGNGPQDFTNLCMTLGTYMLLAAGVAKEEQEAKKLLQDAITSGKALHKLAEFVKAQGGNEQQVYDLSLLPQASIIEPILSEQEGYISHIQCDEIGICSLILGGGRETKESEIDLTVGLILEKKKGDYVKKGDTLAYIHANSKKEMLEAKKRFLNAYTFSIEPINQDAFIKGIVIN